MADNYIARKESGWLVVSMIPDVCKTPVGPALVPIPYPVIAQLQSSDKEVPSVRANGHPVVVYNQSLVPVTLGDQPGVGTGVKSGTVGESVTRRRTAGRCGRGNIRYCVTAMTSG